MSLEEAEKQMNSRGGGPALRAHSRLGALAARGNNQFAIAIAKLLNPPLACRYISKGRCT